MTQDQLITTQLISSEMGRQGEEFALAYERKRLPEFLASKIVHLGKYEISRGYDILSYEDSNSILPDHYIEVKTFRGHPHFYWTDNEIAAARKYGEHYHLYLVDIDKVAVLGYEPTIIPNPALLFNNNSQWTFQVQQYAFTLLSNKQIPTDWDTSTILIGCYNNEQHLQWILNHNLYNVRSQKDAPGAVTLNNPLVHQATYLILYSVATPRVYMLYSLESSPYKVTKTEMLALGYPNPHAFSYILHPIQKQLNSFHIDLTTLLREVNHQGDNTPGSPLYLNGIQLRRFMADSERTTEPSLPITPEQEVQNEVSASKHGTPWSKEEELLLVHLTESQTTIEEIAIKLGRTHSAVATRLELLFDTNNISFITYLHYFNNDPAFSYQRRFKRIAPQK